MQPAFAQPPVTAPQIFDRRLLRQRRARAAGQFADHAALFDAAGEMLLERLDDIRRPFPKVLHLEARAGSLMAGLAARAGTELLVASNGTPELIPSGEGIIPLVADEEWLPFAPASLDLVVSHLGLHWVNDLPGALAQIWQALRPGGAFMAALIGGESLYELRHCLLEAEIQVSGGTSPRVSPTIDLLTMSRLLQRAGFSLPVVDQERITLLYPDLMTMLHDVRGMGESNATLARLKQAPPRRLWQETEKLYRARYATDEGALPLSFDILFLHGWRDEAPNHT